MPLATLFEAPTIEELAQILGRDESPAGWSSLVAIQSSGSRPPFFCIHGAGGTVLIYRELAQRLGPDQPFYGLQSIGLDASCEPLTRIEDMAAAIHERDSQETAAGAILPWRLLHGRNGRIRSRSTASCTGRAGGSAGVVRYDGLVESPTGFRLGQELPCRRAARISRGQFFPPGSPGQGTVSQREDGDPSHSHSGVARNATRKILQGAACRFIGIGAARENLANE